MSPSVPLYKGDPELSLFRLLVYAVLKMQKPVNVETLSSNGYVHHKCNNMA